MHVKIVGLRFDEVSLIFPFLCVIMRFRDAMGTISLMPYLFLLAHSGSGICLLDLHNKVIIVRPR